MKPLVPLFGFFFSVAFPAPAFAQFDPCEEGSGGFLQAGCGIDSFGFVLRQLINFIFVIAVILALGFLVYAGVRWITSGGDKAGVEGARNMLIAAVVGLVVIVLSYFLLNNLILPFLGVNGFSELELSAITGGSNGDGDLDDDLEAIRYCRELSVGVGTGSECDRDSRCRVFDRLGELTCIPN